MIQQCILVGILIIVVIVLFLKSLNIENFEPATNRHSPFNRDNCKDQDYDTENDPDCCNNKPHHIEKSVKDGIREIHIVDPSKSCCIKSCINDFTNVDCALHQPKTGEGDNNLTCKGEEGTLRPDFEDSNGDKQNLHYFLSSNCYDCIKNFKGAVELLANPDADDCEEITQTTQITQ